PRRDPWFPPRPRSLREPRPRRADPGTRPLSPARQGRRDSPGPRPAARADALLRPPARRPPLRAMHQVRRATRRVRARRRHRPDDVRRQASRGSMMALLGYLIRRVFRAITTLLGTTLILFVLVRVVPANPAVSIAGPKADPETLAAIRKDLGLDDPLAVQYGRFLERLVHGGLGRAYLPGRRVAGA